MEKGPASGPLFLWKRSKVIVWIFWHTAVMRPGSVTQGNPLYPFA